jgi:hypothetical protein
MLGGALAACDLVHTCRLSGTGRDHHISAVGTTQLHMRRAISVAVNTIMLKDHVQPVSVAPRPHEHAPTLATMLHHAAFEGNVPLSTRIHAGEGNAEALPLLAFEMYLLPAAGHSNGSQAGLAADDVPAVSSSPSLSVVAAEPLGCSWAAFLALHGLGKRC